MPERFTQRTASSGITVRDLEGAIRRLALYEETDVSLKRAAQQTSGEIELVEITYEQARRDFFDRQIAKYQKKLKWWNCQKPGKQYSSVTIDCECSDCGAIISYYEDALQALEKMEEKDHV